MFFRKEFTGAQLAVMALEQLGITHTFGIPGVHNTELYDELDQSSKITPVLVTHEQGASFMADAVSRTSSSVGCLALVPAAGLTHAMSGIGEAYLDGIPMLVITGGIKRTLGKHYQLHEINQKNIAQGVTKAQFLVESHEEVMNILREVYKVAVSGEPGPVLVEIPFEVMNYKKFVGSEPMIEPVVPERPQVSKEQVRAVVKCLQQSQAPAIYVGWGAVNAKEELVALAELLGAPVATTLQGLGAFPADHPLHVGMGFGDAGVPAGRNAFKGHDCLLAIGLRFSELATGSYGLDVSENLIHIDINPEVFDKNYPAKLSLCGDAKEVLQSLLEELSDMPQLESTTRQAQIASDKQTYFDSWLKEDKGELVNPAFFFKALRQQLPSDAIVVTDDGNHTFLTAELMPIHKGGQFISPTDFNCMGYAIPAAIGAKLANPDKQVVAIVGDGALLMTGMELLTATARNLGIMVFVFADRELGQIGQFQGLVYDKKTCTQLGMVNIEGLAQATGAYFGMMETSSEALPVISEAFEVAQQGKPVLVEVAIDYSRKTCMTKGAAKASFSRFPLREKLRFVGRALSRKLF